MIRISILRINNCQSNKNDSAKYKTGFYLAVFGLFIITANSVY